MSRTAQAKAAWNARRRDSTERHKHERQLLRITPQQAQEGGQTAANASLAVFLEERGGHLNMQDIVILPGLRRS